MYINSGGHNKMEDWKITIIDRTENVLELRRRESYWQHSLTFIYTYLYTVYTFIPNRLNECFVDVPMSRNI